MGGFFRELWHRKVIQFGVGYLIAGWLVIQIAIGVFPELGLPDWADTLAIVMVGLGFPLVLIVAWAQETQASRSEPVGASDDDASTETAPLDDQVLLTLAVLPYDNFTDDEKYASLADSIAEDITAHFASFDTNLMRVKSRNSSFQFKGTSLDVTEIGNQLNVYFIIEGSIRIAGDMLRITSQLVEVPTGNHIWAGHTEEPLAEIGRLQDALTGEIGNACAQKMFQHARELYRNVAEDELTPLGLVLRAQEIGVVDAASRDRRRALVRRAIEKVPDVGIRAVLIGMIADDYAVLFSSNPDEDREEVIRIGEIMLRQAPRRPDILAKLARSYSQIGKFDEAVQLARQLHAIAPGRLSTEELANAAWRAGLIDEAMEHLNELQASARAGDLGPLSWLSGTAVCKGDLEHALQFSDLQALHAAGSFLTWVERANILAGLGRMEEARECLSRVRKMLPRFSLENAIKGFVQSHATEQSQDRMTAGLKLLLAEETAAG